MDNTKIFYNGQLKRLHKTIKIFEQFESPYKLEEYGSTKIFFDDYGLKRFFNTSMVRINGFHLSRLVKDDLEKRVENGQYVYINQDSSRRHVKTVFYNKKGCKTNKGAMISAIDINSCYWETAHNLGIISDRVYNFGYARKEQYKHARNVAIGSLGRIKRVTIYNPGMEKETYYEILDTNCARLDIIDYIWGMAVNVASELGDSFCFFLTDCFYVNEKDEKKAIKLIENYNYTIKIEKHRLIKLEKRSKSVDAVHWERINPEKKNKNGIHQFNHYLELVNIIKEMRIKS